MHTIYIGNDGTNVDLKPYTGSTLYQFPYDGYVTVNSGTGVTVGKYIRVAIRSRQGFNVAHVYMVVQGPYQIESVFVRKGMQALFAGSDATNNYSVTYYPLTD